MYSIRSSVDGLDSWITVCDANMLTFEEWTNYDEVDIFNTDSRIYGLQMEYIAEKVKEVVQYVQHEEQC